MKNINRLNRYTYLILAVATFFLGLFIFRNAHFGTSGDDAVYRSSIETWGSWGKWAYAYYHGNSGRVLIHTLLIIFTNLPTIVWQLSSAGMVAVTCCMLYSIAMVNVRRPKWYIVLTISIVAVGLYVSLPRNVWNDSVLWGAGSLNYLYPVSALLLCLFAFWKLFAGEKLSNWFKVVVFISAFLCGNMEQSSAVLMAMGLLSFGYYYWGKGKSFCLEHKSDIIFLVSVWGISTSIALTGYFAPGNAARYSEELMAFAGYEMLTIPEKMIIGIQLLIMYFYSFRGLMVWLLPSFILILKNIGKGRYKECAAPVINILLSGVQNILIRKVFNLELVHPFDCSYMIWLGLSIALLFYNAGLVLRCAHTKEEHFWYLFIYYGLVAAGAVVCFSPTVHVSASRTMYISYIMLFVLILLLLRSVFIPCETDSTARRIWSRFNCVLGIVVSLTIVTAFVIGMFTVKQIDAASIKESAELSVTDIVIDKESNTMDATVNIQPYAYTANNWCSGKLDGYVFNTHVGIWDTKTGMISLYRTYIHSQNSCIKEYPGGVVTLTGYFGRDVELTQDQQLVIVYTENKGDTWYTPIEQSVILEG